MAYRAAIIGCGLIGSGFSDTVRIPGTWSHAAAYIECPDTDLVALCDLDTAQMNRCGERWSVRPRYRDFSTMLDKAQPEIVSICTPDTTHYDIIQTAVAHPAVRAIFAEKPLATSLVQAGELVRLATEHGKILAVNYSRRYAPGFNRLREILADGTLGAVQAISGYYTKGTLHNGTHWFDLANLLIGPVHRVTAIDRLREPGADPTLDVILEFVSGATGCLHGCDATNFAIFEMDIVCRQGRVRMVDSGLNIEIYRVVDSPYGAGYRQLGLYEELDGGLETAMLSAVVDITNCLHTGCLPLSTAETALQALEVGFSALQSSRTGQPVDLVGVW